MSWISVAIIAYLFLALANLLDKFLIDNILSSSKAYVFVACVLGSVVLLASPWILEWPGTYFFIWNLLMGAIFSVALWLLYEALKRGEASRTLVFVGGITPIFSIILSLIFLHETFTINQYLGLAFLLLGVFVIALLPKHKNFLSHLLKHLNIEQLISSSGLKFAFFSALAYSLYFVGSKYAFNHQSFASAFLWSRLGATLFVLLLLIRRRDRQEIFGAFRKMKPGKHKFLVIFGQGLGSTGFILQNYAVFLGSVALVNAMQGVQYAFILIISAVLAIVAPRLLKEKLSWPIMAQKILAVLIIAVGLYFITFN